MTNHIQSYDRWRSPEAKEVYDELRTTLARLAHEATERFEKETAHLKKELVYLRSNFCVPAYIVVPDV